MDSNHIDEKLYKIFNGKISTINRKVGALISDIDAELLKLNSTTGRDEYASIESWEHSRDTLRSFIDYLTPMSSFISTEPTVTLEPLNRDNFIKIVDSVNASHSMVRIGKYARVLFEECFKYQLPEVDLLHFTNKDWCHDNLGICYPLLLKRDSSISLEEQRRYNSGYGRYYAKEVVVNGDLYLLCSQWFKEFEPKLQRWIETRKSGDFNKHTEYKNAQEALLLDGETIGIQDDNFTNKNPIAIFISGRRIDVVNKYDMWIKVCEYLIGQNEHKFNQMIKDNIIVGRNNHPYLSDDPDMLRRPAQLKDSIYFTETNFSGEKIRRMIMGVLKYFKIPYECCAVYYKEGHAPSEPSSKKSNKALESNNINKPKEINVVTKSSIHVSSGIIYFGRQTNSLSLQLSTFTSLLKFIRAEQRRHEKFDFGGILKYLTGKTGYTTPRNATRKIIEVLKENGVIAPRIDYQRKYYTISNKEKMQALIENPSLLETQSWELSVCEQADLWVQNKPIVVTVLDKQQKKRCPVCNNMLDTCRLKYDVYKDRMKNEVERQQEMSLKRCPECQKYYLTRKSYNGIIRQQHNYIPDRTDFKFVDGM